MDSHLRLHALMCRGEGERHGGREGGVVETRGTGKGGGWRMVGKEGTRMEGGGVCLRVCKGLSSLPWLHAAFPCSVKPH